MEDYHSLEFNAWDVDSAMNEDDDDEVYSGSDSNSYDDPEDRDFEPDQLENEEDEFEAGEDSDAEENSINSLLNSEYLEAFQTF